jgi:DNA topoisomerase-1
MIKKFGRYGTFLACTGYPDCKHTINLDKAGNHAPLPEAKVLGEDPTTKLPIYLKTGRFGTYVQLGDKPEAPKKVKGKKKEKAPKPKSASLLPDMKADELTLEQALQLLSLPKTLGQNPTGEDIVVANGRFGPYVKAGVETRSLTDGQSPITLTLAEAEKLLAEPKAANRKRTAGGATMKELGNHPDSGKPIKVKNGRFGAYVTDGETNATIPRGTEPSAITLEQALELIKEREGQPKKKRGRKK